MNLGRNDISFVHDPYWRCILYFHCFKLHLRSFIVDRGLERETVKYWIFTWLFHFHLAKIELMAKLVRIASGLTGFHVVEYFAVRLVKTELGHKNHPPLHRLSSVRA